MADNPQKADCRGDADTIAWWGGRGSLPAGCWLAVLLIAVFLRFFALDLKPAHFDEGVNSLFLSRMQDQQVYNYAHDNYHGPLHFYLTFPFVMSLGFNEVALRILPALFSTATVVLILMSSTVIGRLSSLLAAVFFAVSPGTVFYSRYGIHEAELCFFVALFALSVSKLLSTGKESWLLAGVLAVAGGILTKETFFINMSTLPMAIFVVWGAYKALPEWIMGGHPYVVAKARWRWAPFLATLLVSAAVIELFYSGFLTSEAWGWGEFLKSYTAWSGTADNAAGHQKPVFDIFGGRFNYYWFYLMGRYEWPFIIACAAGAAFWTNVSPEGKVSFAWALGMVTAYSLIPYKTPWCILSMMPAVAVAVGTGLSVAALTLVRNPFHCVFLPLLVVASLLPVTMALNFKNYDAGGDKEPYSYVQTNREAFRFLEEIKSAAKSDPRACNLPGRIAVKSYFPIPMWLAGQRKLGYDGKDGAPKSPNSYWVIVPQSQGEEFLSNNKGREWREVSFRLRDGQPELTAFFDASVYPSTGDFNFPNKTGRGAN